MIQKTLLLDWYWQNKRELPWRKLPYNKSLHPYRIWIAEVMLQQTTSVAVIPYYKAFLKRFPSLKYLALAQEGEILESWSGLGYYQRAKNIHKTAQIIYQKYNGKFPQTWQKLITLPGIGPYTARAIASFAFGQKTGVLDGNVIRFLSRCHLIKEKWWTSQGRKVFQVIADQYANDGHVADINQALIEIGATVCLPQSPICPSCPVRKKCKAYQSGQAQKLPLVRLRRKLEPWLWRPSICMQKGKVLLVKNHQKSFLKNQWIWPGPMKKVKTAPEKFDFKHTITHHNIYVRIHPLPSKNFQEKLNKTDAPKWVPLSDVKKHSPTSLIAKTISHSGLSFRQK